MQFIPVFILSLLFFVMMFGISFILNMLLKTTWLPMYLFFFVLLPSVVYSLWNKDVSFGAHLCSFQPVDYLTMLMGISGTFLSGLAIQKLRLAGYKMF